ncbi:MAG: hypothetical protein AUJ96_21145 [Armatimonadetes bacterium CG2_30_66_41]|nr:MAG: hypothetical protein AUJ96_21145 [Armatimonadetes bacterium CG2_30_66_41]PJB70882.1 MAG: hypothetical protein CO096_10690 [Armatimonadetes bacterium CG_4_9_14_3_um_filter_66_14]
MIRTTATLAALAAATSVLADPATPLPRVFATYSSWLQGSYRFRDVQVPLYAELGWPYDRRENVQVADLMADLDRYDLFLPPSLYNYDHAQPFEQYTDRWRGFLERGGVIVALDANYGQMIGWVTRLGEGLELQSTQCPEGMKGHPPLKLVAPGDPAAPPPTAKTPWAHFASYGKGWKVLATCPEGNAVCLRADIGKGILVATNLYDDADFPTAEYVNKLWQAQWPRLMDHDLSVALTQGPEGVGRKAYRLSLTPPTAATLVCERRRGEGATWEANTVPLPADGQPVEVPLLTRGGRNEVRLEVRVDGVRRWWTSWAETPPDVLREAAALRARLEGDQVLLTKLPADHPLRQQADELSKAEAAVSREAGQLVAGDAGPAIAQRWQGLAEQLTGLGQQLRTVTARATVAARADGDRAFAVVRSAPLEKVFRDEAPAGPTAGEVQLTAARNEGESAQVVLVPLRGDLVEVRVHLEPFVGANGKRLEMDAALHRVCYVHTDAPSAGAPAGRDWWPDPLLPADKPFAVKHVCQPLWVDLWTPPEAGAGDYTGSLVIEAAGQTERVPLRLHLLDFALPHEHSLRQVFAFRASQITQRYNGQADYKTATPIETYLRMMDVCLKRRVGVQTFGWEGSPDPVSAMAYMGETMTPTGWEFDFTQADRLWQHQFDSGLRTLFVGFTPGCGSASPLVQTEEYWTFLEAYLKALVPHLKAKGWFDSAVWYMVDECWQEDAVQANLRLAKLMDELAPGLKRLMTAPRDPRLHGKSQIWVPGGLPEADPENADNKRLLEGWAPFAPERWWYICCGPTHPYPNFFADYSTLDPRMVFWLTWKYHKSGFLYWGVEYHGDPKEMTADGPTDKYTLGPANMGNGDGTLCYWGPNQEFYPSIRLNAIRDGIEDYEYFALARALADELEKKGQTPELMSRARKLLAVDERVLKTTAGVPNFKYSLDPQTLLSARDDLARLILDLSRFGR